MQKRNFKILCLIVSMLLTGKSDGSNQRPFDDAVVVWQMADSNDSSGQNSRLAIVGDVKLGLKSKAYDKQASLARGGDGKFARFNGGYLFAGQGASDELILNGSQMSILFRVRDPEGPLFSKGCSGYELAYNLYATTIDGKDMIGFKLGPKNIASIHGIQAELEHNGWHDVIARYDGISMELFIDGQFVGATGMAGLLRDDSRAPCLIGAEMDNGDVRSGFHGLVDHAALWNRALTNEEIAQLCNVDIVTVPAKYLERYRPQFHFTALWFWINDPNGLFYHNGVYHLYFQHMPDGRHPAFKDWGHAVSKDLIHWKQVSSGLVTEKDLGGCWSGSAVVDHHNTAGFQAGDNVPIIAIVTLGGPPGVGPLCTQDIAYSLDDGYTFKYYEKNPVIDHLVVDNRDPKVIWYEPTKCWIMALFLDGDQFALFSSSNLKDWKMLHELRVPGAGECPDFFPLAVDGNPDNIKWVFWTANGRYLVGNFDGVKFEKEQDLKVADFSRNFYAAQTFSDIPKSDGRCIQIAWLWGGEYPGMPFTQQLSFPTELTLRTTPEGITLFRVPVRELENIRGQKHQWTNRILNPGDNPLSALNGDLFEIQTTIELKDASSFGFNIRGEAINYDVAENKVSFRDQSMIVKPENGKIKLQILVDRMSTEIFANDGNAVMSSVFLPKDDNMLLKVYSNGGQVKLDSLIVYELKSIWN